LAHSLRMMKEKIPRKNFKQIKNHAKKGTSTKIQIKTGTASVEFMHLSVASSKGKGKNPESF